MASVNKVILVGRLGGDPEVKYSRTGKTVAKLSIATDESCKDKEGSMVKKTEWHTVILWDRRAEVAGEFLSKGSQVYIEGKLQTRSWEGRDGHKRYTTEIIGSNLVMLGSKPNGNAQESTAPREAESQAAGISRASSNETPVGKDSEDPLTVADDDIPF